MLITLIYLFPQHTHQTRHIMLEVPRALIPLDKNTSNHSHATRYSYITVSSRPTLTSLKQKQHNQKNTWLSHSFTRNTTSAFHCAFSSRSTHSTLNTHNIADSVFNLTKESQFLTHSFTQNTNLTFTVHLSRPHRQLTWLLHPSVLTLKRLTSPEESVTTRSRSQTNRKQMRLTYFCPCFFLASDACKIEKILLTWIL